MVNTSLKKLKHHLAIIDVVVKERTTATTITEGTWGFEHTKACFRDEIITFIKSLKDFFNSFDQFLIDKLSEVQHVFYQIEHAVEQHRVESKGFQVKMNKVLNKNERLLEQAISKDIVNIVVTSNFIPKTSFCMFKSPRALSDGCGSGSFFDYHINDSKMVFKLLQTCIHHANLRKFFRNLNLGGSGRKIGFVRIHIILRPKDLFSR
nr:hypothetical protein [Tanacetum cinerariifolium]